MRRFQGLLIAAGLAAAPAGAVAGPSPDPWTPGDVKAETFDWSMAKGRLGVLVMSMTPELREHLGAAKDRGVLVERVEPGSPAAAAGLAVGDVIVEVRGHVIDDAADVMSALAGVEKGQHVAVEVIRDGKKKSLQATFADQPAASSWLEHLFKPLLTPKQASVPFDEEWFREVRGWLRPHHPMETNEST